MKKYLILFSLVIMIFSFQKKNYDEKLIESFCEKIIKKNNKNFDDTIEYVTYSSDFLKNKNKNQIVMSILNDLKEQLLENNYNIITHKKLLKIEKFKVLRFSEEYKNSNTYHLISANSLITSFIIKDGKIKSLSSNIIKKLDQIRTPLIL